MSNLPQISTIYYTHESTPLCMGCIDLTQNRQNLCAKLEVLHAEANKLKVGQWIFHHWKKYKKSHGFLGTILGRECSGIEGITVFFETKMDRSNFLFDCIPDMY